MNDLCTETCILSEKEVTHELSDFKMHCHLNCHTVDVHTLITQGQITFLYGFSPSYLKHCWQEVHSAQLHLISVPTVQFKHYKDSRSKVKSTSGKGKKKKANPSWIHLIKAQRAHHSFGQFQRWQHTLWGSTKRQPGCRFTMLDWQLG